MSNFNRSVINALLPPGPKWVPEPLADFDLWLDGLADNIDDPLAYIESLAALRDPLRTTQLDDLEREYGIVTKTNLIEDQRRKNLEAKIYERGGTGSADNLQAALIRSGFDVQVHENSPAVNPAIFLDQAFQITVGDPVNGFVGDPLAYLGRVGGELLVNGAIYDQRPVYLSELNGPNAFVGDPLMTLGDFDIFVKDRLQFPVPTDPDAWPFIFFVGGNATRAGTGALIDIERAELPAQQREEFENIILAYKPMHAWAGLIVTFK